MTNMLTQRKASQNQRVRNLQERVTGLEQALEGVDQVLRGLSQRILGPLQDVVETVQVLMDEVGKEKVLAEVSKRRVDRARGRIEDAVKAGQLEVVETASLTSIMVGHEVDAAGATIPPGYNSVNVVDMSEEAKALFVGKKVGDRIEGTGGAFVVDQILEQKVEVKAEA